MVFLVVDDIDHFYLCGALLCYFWVGPGGFPLPIALGWFSGLVASCLCVVCYILVLVLCTSL